MTQQLILILISSTPKLNWHHWKFRLFLIYTFFVSNYAQQSIETDPVVSDNQQDYGKITMLNPWDEILFGPQPLGRKPLGQSRKFLTRMMALSTRLQYPYCGRLWTFSIQA
jgi:hypothetical protein